MKKFLYSATQDPLVFHSRTCLRNFCSTKSQSGLGARHVMAGGAITSHNWQKHCQRLRGSDNVGWKGDTVGIKMVNAKPRFIMDILVFFFN